MLHTRLLEIVNSRQAWAFVGSGPSTDAGAPSWSALVEGIATEPGAADLRSDTFFTNALQSGNYPRCLSLIEDAIGREALERHVSRVVGAVDAPGPIHRLLADLPFAGYITTNYDGLLEAALAEREPGWIPVGNSSGEVRKVSGDVKGIVWHIHGALRLPQEASRLVLTTRDYDDFYLEDSSVLQQLRSVIAQRRIIIVGFGFADQEVLRILKRVGRLADPARPVFAFLPKKGEFSSTTGRGVWLHESNIDITPYKIRNGSHGALKDLLEIYSSLSLRRSIKYRGHGAAPPSYDPETTGLLIYNELVLARGLQVPSDIRAALMRAHLLAQLHSRGPSTANELAAGAEEAAQRLSSRVVDALPADQVRSLVGAAFAELESLDLVSFDSTTQTYTLTETGIANVAEHAAIATRLGDQFSASLRARAVSLCIDDTAAQRVAFAAEAFLKSCVEKRALGVAMAIALKQIAQQEYHMLALLQSLGEHLEALEDEGDARCLLELIQQVLRSPSSIEREYIGVTLQARFGVHLLGYDDTTLAARVADVNETCFIIDSTALIALLARSSPNSAMSLTLIHELRRCGATVLTTPMLAGEVTEHIQWAQSRIAEGGGSFQSVPVLEAATGRAGQRSNAFLEGFAVELAQGRAASFGEYIRDACALDHVTARVAQAQVELALAGREILTYSVDKLTGWEPDMLDRLQEHQARLQHRRETAKTFTREAQVEAEAEALSIVAGVRSEVLRIPQAECSNAYFISNTRIIDQIAETEIPVTMKPEAAVQWLVTLHPCSIEELGTLTSGLLWELQERGQDLVDVQTLVTAFGPLIEASEEARDAEIARLRALTGSVYAGTADALEVKAEGLDLPVILSSHSAQLVKELEEALREERQRADAAERDAALSDSERHELALYREKNRKRAKYQRRMDRQKDGAPKRRKRRR